MSEIEMNNDKKVYIVMNNTDRTEGRGEEYVYAVTELLATAERVAKDNYVQGTDCPIREEEVVIFNGKPYLHINKVAFVLPTGMDFAEEELKIKKMKKDRELQEILKKAKSLGLTENDIKVLQQSDMS